MENFMLFWILVVPQQTSLCGYPPFPPFGCQYHCVCHGTDCEWVLFCDGDDE